MNRSKLVEEIIRLQRRVDHARRQYQIDVWMDLPLTIAQLKSLLFIRNQGSTTSGKLAAALGVTPTNITGIVDRLIRQGLVSRTEDPGDRRVLLLRVTGKGEELTARLRERRRGYMTEVLGHMDDEDLAALARGLSLLVRAVESHEGGQEQRN